MIGLSANTLGSHEGWIKDIDEVTGSRVAFPIIADKERKAVANRQKQAGEQVKRQKKLEAHQAKEAKAAEKRRQREAKEAERAARQAEKAAAGGAAPVNP